MKIRNQAAVCLWENAIQVYDVLIVCLDTDRNSTFNYALIEELWYIFLSIILSLLSLWYNHSAKTGKTFETQYICFFFTFKITFPSWKYGKKRLDICSPELKFTTFKPF